MADRKRRSRSGPESLTGTRNPNPWVLDQGAAATSVTATRACRNWTVSRIARSPPTPALPEAPSSYRWQLRPRSMLPFFTPPREEQNIALKALTAARPEVRAGYASDQAAPAPQVQVASPERQPRRLRPEHKAAEKAREEKPPTAPQGSQGCGRHPQKDRTRSAAGRTVEEGNGEIPCPLSPHVHSTFGGYPGSRQSRCPCPPRNNGWLICCGAELKPTKSRPTNTIANGLGLSAVP